MATEKAKAFYLQVAERLIAQLEAGTSPYQKPWDAGYQLPYNLASGARYRGINVVSLISQGRSDPRWMTYSQAQAAGYQVRRGEKATQVEFWSFTKQTKATDERGATISDDKGQPVYENEKRQKPLCRLYSVFNAEQIDGVPPLEQRTPVPNIERADAILAASGAVIEHGHDGAAYAPRSDKILMPDREAFHGPAQYYATALHELGHWTGHPTRLDRDLSHPFGSVPYAKEELRAETASLMLGDELGIGSDFQNHAAYIASWIKVLQDEPEFLVTACRDANKIFDYVLGLEQRRELAKEEHMVRESRQWNENEIKAEYGQVLKQAGLVIEGDPVMDGTFRRVAVDRNDKPRNLDGGYVGFLDGHPAGYFVNHYAGVSDNWKAKGYFISQEQAADARAAAATKQAQRRVEREAQYDEAARAVRANIAQQQNAPVKHPYFVEKGVFIPGLTVDGRNNLVVPVRDMEGQIVSAALVNKGWKGITPNTRLKGGFFILGDLPAPGYRGDIGIVEGVATGATVHRATGMPVAVAFVNTNLGNVAEAFQEAYPDAERWILGDDDRHKAQNSGVKTAKLAAWETRAQAIFPRFLRGEQGSAFSDFNDLQRVHGESVVRQQIHDAQAVHRQRAKVGLELTSLNPQTVDRLFNSDGETIEVRMGRAIGEGLRQFTAFNRTTMEQQQFVANEKVLRSAVKKYGVRVDENHDLDKNRAPEKSLQR